MRRAAVSVPANIAEGFREFGTVDKARFMNTAEGSVEENPYYLILTQDLGCGETGALMSSLEEGQSAPAELRKGDLTRHDRGTTDALSAEGF
jgi:four helix bundle protein